VAIDAQEALQAYLKAELLRKESLGQREPNCIVTISREAGIPGARFGRALARRMGLPFYDRELLEAIAEGVGVAPHELEFIDEHACGLEVTWLERILTRKCELSEAYRRNLAIVVMRVACGGGVILGRGANFLIAGCRHALRLRLIGSPEVRASRFAEARGIPRDEARRQVEAIDRDRAGFVRELTGHDVDDCHGYDLVLDMDDLREETALDIVFTALGDKRCTFPGKPERA
jgi:cytidylate kinase